MQYLKAIYAAAFAGLGAAATAYTAGNGHIGYQAGITIAMAVLAAGGSVWGVPNAAKRVPFQAPEPPAPPAA